MPAPRLSRRGIRQAAPRAPVAWKRPRICSSRIARRFTSYWCAKPARRFPTPSPRCARRPIFAATTRCGRASNSRPPHRLEGPTGEINELIAAGTRRVRLHQSLEFSAGDFCRPGDRGAGGGQCRGRKAGRTHAADCRALRGLLHEAGVPRQAAASGADAGTPVRRDCAGASRARGRRNDGFDGHRLDDQSCAGRARRSYRAADRRNRRLECHDRRFDRAA